MTKAIDRIKRGTSLAKIALEAIKVKRARTDEDKVKARRVLIALMADAKGVPLKIGQLLSTLDDGDEYKAISKGIKPRPLAEMLSVLEEGLGVNTSQVFTELHESNAAASLGQVHKAKLLDGTLVAVKIQYPNIAQAVETEMKIMGLMPGMGPIRHWGFDMSGYKEVLKTNMDHELSYDQEALRQKRFGEELRIKGLVIPKVFPDLCSKRVLVQEWCFGGSLDMVLPWPKEDKRVLGRTLLGTLFQSLFVINEVHTDPHLGNAFYRSDSQGNPEFVLLDFGCTMPVKNEVSLSLLKLIIAAHENSATDCFSCLVNCGFEEEKLAHIANTLPALCKLMFEPFLNDDPFLTDDWNLSSRMDSLLGDLRWWFRSAAPPNFLLLLRAFQGVVSQLQTLEVGIPWWTVLVEVVGEDRMHEARNFATPKIDQISRNVATYDALAEKLKVLVTEEGQQVVALTLPAATVLNLKDTMPEHVITEIEKQNIDLNHIIRTACEGGLGAEPLFSIQVRKRNYKVWLE